MVAPYQARRGRRLSSRPITLRIACLVALAASLSCARPPRDVFPPSPSETRIVLAVATWNMHAGRGDLSRLLYDLASGVLTRGVPDDYVILVQEDIEPSSHSARAAAMTSGLAFFFAPVRGDERRMSGNAILSTRPLQDPRVLALERERQPRSAVAATIRLDSDTLFIVDVHLENRVTWWRALFSDTARRRQARALLEQLPEHEHGILGGDLNTWLGPREPAWRDMLQRFPDTPRDPPQPTFHDRLVLDHLFFDLPAGWTATRRVVKDAYGSDHHPVVAIVSPEQASD
jgi:endonuclease/exonuclease/phosphatase family metal-dependent hydrolase